MKSKSPDPKPGYQMFWVWYCVHLSHLLSDARRKKMLEEPRAFSSVMVVYAACLLLRRALPSAVCLLSWTNPKYRWFHKVPA